MDEVAFVESLFQPELRTSPPPQPSPTRSLLISASLTPASPTLTLPLPSPLSPRLRSFKFMQANGSSAVSPGILRVGVDDEDMLRQILGDHEFEEPNTLTTQVENMVDHLQASSLLEPISLPKNNAYGSLLDPAFKDAFLGLASPSMPSPSTYGQASFKMFSPTSQTPRGSILDPHLTPRSSLYNDSLMPVQPIGASNYVNPPTSMSAIEALQQAVWSNNPNGNAQRLNPNSIKDVMRAATTASGSRHMSVSSLSAPSLPVTTPRMQFAPPTAPMWVPMTLLTPTALSQNAPDLNRCISSKKSKARKSSYNHSAPSTTAASALASSLATEVTPKKRVAASRAVKTAPALVAAPVQMTSDSDEAESKAAKGKKCIEEGCVRRAQSNSRCKAHGGGARCQYDGPGGCTRSSQGGGFCRAHGGGKRCEYPGCTRGQQRKGRCYVHGGIRKCQTEGCEKKDRGNGFCISHGGGKRCVFPGCSRSVRRGNLCHLHEDTASVS